jgi:hypothetical protein
MDGPQHCRRVRGALCAIRQLCPDILTVRGCWLGPASEPLELVEGFISFEASLMVKAFDLRGWRAGLGAPEPLEPVEGFVLLCHAVHMTC